MGPCRPATARLLLAALSLCLAPVIARADGPLLQGFGGAMPGPETIDEIQRLGREAQARSSGRAFGDSMIVPEHPGKNNVRYYGFEWEHYDYLDDRGVGGVRLYFYRREAEVARIAGAIVRDEYEALVHKFNYRPTTQVPYILYNSHREFENTNVFFVDEYILGVTSPEDLRMALPYWGEINLFRQVSKHEMTHQFQIQKMNERAAAAGVESAIDKLPLWFTEGLAEYYSKDGIDLETDMFARDIILNPRPEKKYAVPDFWDDSAPSYINTYKLGQIRVAFLADQYGERIIQAIIDDSPRLSLGGIFSFTDAEHDTFKQLVAHLAREKPEAISQRFSTWLKRRYYPTYLSTRQEPPGIPFVPLEGEPDAFTVGADGHTLLYRTVERDSGRARLYLADRRDKTSAVMVAADGTPAVESLYPVLRNVMAISPTSIAFLARKRESDILVVVPYTKNERNRHVELRLGRWKEIDLSRSNLIEAGDPTFSPDGDRVAFFALDDLGRIDLWTAETATGKLRRLTDDHYSERDLTWSKESPAVYGVPIQRGGGQDGTLLYTCDHTEHRRYNLVALDPATGASRRLTDEPADERAPAALGNGRIVFASDAEGKQDLHIYDTRAKTITRITDFETSLTSPATSPIGLMALGFYSGEYRIFDIPTEKFLSVDVRPAVAEIDEPEEAAPTEAIPPAAPAYEPYKVSNWRLQNGVAAIGTSAFGDGALLFGDVLSDRSILAQFSLYGSLSLTDAQLFYFDRSGRQQWGFGIFQTFTERRDISPPGFTQDVFYLERDFGGQGLWSYPLDLFTRIEARASIAGEQRSFLFPTDSSGLATPVISLPDLRAWDSVREGYDLKTEASVRFAYDTTRVRFPVGAAGGGSFVSELGAGYLPTKSQAYWYGMFDAQYHLSIFRFAYLQLRLASGIALGSVYGRQFWLSSYDNLRAYFPYDPRLIGNVYAVGNLNFEVPLDAVIKIAFFSNVKAIFGMDIGSIAGTPEELWGQRVLDGVIGVNLGLGPFEIRIQFAKPINLGNNILPPAWVPNISLQYAYF